MTGRLRVPIDAYMLLERDGRMLMLRRAPDAAYAAGLLCPPSRHGDEGETVSDAAIREAAEGNRVRPTPDEGRCGTGVPQRRPARPARLGRVFAARRRWGGGPV